jgi:hypothetical protein
MRPQIGRKWCVWMQSFELVVRDTVHFNLYKYVKADGVIQTKFLDLLGKNICLIRHA